MIRNLLILLFLCTTYTLVAQGPPGGNRGGGQSGIKGKITGELRDSLTGEAVPYAAILLLNAANGEQVNGTLSEEDGSFKFRDVSTGKYRMEISFVGFNKKSVPVETTPEKPDTDMGVIYLGASSILLEGVEVVAEEALIENRIDKIVYNADKDAGLAGADATELLRKVPLLSVDLQGNVSLRGSSNVQILINGRPSALMAENPGEALQSIPAEQIKEVEVITAPTAKYDGEGSAGIINIITKRAEIEGFSGSVGGSIGNINNNYNANAAAVFGRFGMNLNGGGWYSWPNTTLQDYYREDYLPAGTSTISDVGEGISERVGYRGTLAAYYDFNAYTSINSSFSLRGFNRFNDNETETVRYDAVADDTENFLILSETDRLRTGFEWTTDYRRKFRREGQELIIAFQWDGSFSDQNNFFDQTDLTGMDPDLERMDINTNNGDNNEYTLQLDYTHPVGEWLKIETGAKGVARRIDSDYASLSYNFATDEYETVADQTDLFFYEQDIYAGYLSGTFALGEKWGLITGLRYEYTGIDSRFEEANGGGENDFQNWLPSMILSYQLSQTANIKMTYTRRIQRPGLRYVNPYNNQSNSLNRSVGNPFLDPESVDQVELSAGTFSRKLSLNASVFYRFTDDIIESYISIEDGVAVTEFQNIGTNRSVGINIFASSSIQKWLTLRGGINVFTYDGRGTVEGNMLSNRAILFNGNFSGTISLPGNWKIEAFAFYRSPRQTLQGQQTSFYMYTLGARKEFWNKRASVGIRIVQPFQRYLVFENIQEGPTFFLDSSTSIPFRSFGLSLSYKFGKLDFRERRNRSAIDNDDVKGGGDDGGQGF